MHTAGRSRGPRYFWISAAAAVLVAICAISIIQHNASWPKRFGVVHEGRLYRCGDVSVRQLQTLTHEKGVRTVLSLLNPNTAESRAEREAAEQLGIRWINVPLPGDGASTSADRDAIRSVILDDASGPTLVHCAAGTNRTGLACGMYRIHRQGWSVAKVLDEMRRYGF